MTRTIISLAEDDKSWLEQKAKEQGVAMTHVVREAIRRLRAEESVSFHKILKETKGSWRNGDGLAWQQKIRKEW